MRFAVSYWGLRRLDSAWKTRFFIPLPRQLGVALGAIGASDQFHILMGGHPTVFVKKQEGGPCDHLTLS